MITERSRSILTIPALSKKDAHFCKHYTAFLTRLCSALSQNRLPPSSYFISLACSSKTICTVQV